MLQSLTATEVKNIVDSFNGDPAAREAARAALQAVVGCAGATAGGANCGSAAVGAAAAVVINNLIVGGDVVRRGTPQVDAQGNILNEPTVEEENARTNIVGSLIAAIAVGAGIDAQSATNAATIEAENNATRLVRLSNGKDARIADPGDKNGATVAELLSYKEGNPRPRGQRAATA